MKRISKIIVAILIGVITIFGVAGCNDDTQKQLQSKIDELQAQITQLQQTLNDKDEENEDLQGQIDELQQVLEEKTEERDGLQKQIDELKQELARKSDKNTVLLELMKEQLQRLEEMGEYPTITTKYTYTLDEVYESGLITREDVMHFCYYSYGNVYEGTGTKYQQDGEWQRLDFTPTEEQGTLSESMEVLIKYAYFFENLDEFYYRGTLLTRPEMLQVKNYFVTSDGYYIVQPYSGGGAGVICHYYCAGIAWTTPMPQSFFVFKCE